LSLGLSGKFAGSPSPPNASDVGASVSLEPPLPPVSAR
jgi:hypothetical protein